MVALAAIIAVGCVASAALWFQAAVLRRRERLHERKEAAWAGERQQLLDRIMYMAEKPWTPPPLVEEPGAPEIPYYFPEDELIESDSLL